MRNFAKYLLLAQAASDAGKGYKPKASNAKNAIRRGYGLKDQYIDQAISETRCLSAVKVKSGYDADMGMHLVYFDIKGYGQVSFHTYKHRGNIPCTGVWNKRVKGSLKTCRLLAKRLNLPHYSKGVL